MMSDKDRMDFLEAQGFTRWVGYGTQRAHCTWPIFAGDSFRAGVDKAIVAKQRNEQFTKDDE